MTAADTAMDWNTRTADELCPVAAKYASGPRKRRRSRSGRPRQPLRRGFILFLRSCNDKISARRSTVVMGRRLSGKSRLTCVHRVPLDREARGQKTPERQIAGDRVPHEVGVLRNGQKLVETEGMPAMRAGRFSGQAIDPLGQSDGIRHRRHPLSSALPGVRRPPRENDIASLPVRPARPRQSRNEADTDENAPAPSSLLRPRRVCDRRRSLSTMKPRVSTADLVLDTTCRAPIIDARRYVVAVTAAKWEIPACVKRRKPFGGDALHSW